MSGTSTTEPSLTPWQETQAAMLYEFSSIGYLQRVQAVVADAAAGRLAPLLWLTLPGERRSRCGTPAFDALGEKGCFLLRDLAESLASDVRKRHGGKMWPTGMDDWYRSLERYGPDAWGGERENDLIEYLFGQVSRLTHLIDITYDTRVNRWSDHHFASEVARFRRLAAAPRRFIPRSQVRARSGEPAPRTGVYFCPDDPHATLQFCWTAGGGMRMREASAERSCDWILVEAVAAD